MAVLKSILQALNIESAINSVVTSFRRALIASLIYSLLFCAGLSLIAAAFLLFLISEGVDPHLSFLITGIIAIASAATLWLISEKKLTSPFPKNQNTDAKENSQNELEEIVSFLLKEFIEGYKQNKEKDKDHLE